MVFGRGKAREKFSQAGAAQPIPHASFLTHCGQPLNAWRSSFELLIGQVAAKEKRSTIEVDRRRECQPAFRLASHAKSTAGDAPRRVDLYDETGMNRIVERARNRRGVRAIGQRIVAEPIQCLQNYVDAMRNRATK